MPQSRAQLCFSAEQVAAFRLERHHLLQRKQASLASICSNVCGIQAQVMSAAEVALGIRSMGHTREDVHRALWQTRTLVKTSCMRMTLHLIPASEFSLYIAALKQSRTAAILGLLNRRLRVTPAEVAKMNQVAVEALSEGPLTQRELVEKAKKKAGKRLKIWLELGAQPGFDLRSLRVLSVMGQRAEKR